MVKDEDDDDQQQQQQQGEVGVDRFGMNVKAVPMGYNILHFFWAPS